MSEANLTPTLRHLRRVIAERCDGGLSDDRLLERFASSRDEAAFEVLVWRHGPMVLGLCRRLLGKHHDAEDAMQATFLALARQARSIGKRASLASWLFKVAYRIALRARGRAGRHVAYPTPVELLAAAQEPEPVALAELRLALDEELHLLPEKYRTPLVLSYLQGLTNHEVAGQLGCPVGTVFTRLARGRDLLRARLVRRGVALAGAGAALLTEASAAAMLPAALVQTTTQAAAAFTEGPAAAVGVVAPGVLTLAEGTLEMSALTRPASVAAILLLLAVSAAGFLAAGMPARDQGKSTAQRLLGAAPPPRTHGHGDPLPDGAVARFGSIGLRHAGLADYTCLPGSKVVVSAGRDGFLRFWEMAPGRQVREVRIQGKARLGREGALSPNGKMLAGLDGERLVLWEVDSGKEVKALRAPKGNVACLYFSPDGKTLGAWTWDMHVTLYEWRAGKERRIALPPRSIGMGSDYHGHFSPDGKHLVGGGGVGQALCLFEAATGRELHRFHCNTSTSIFTPDGKQLAVCCMADGKPGSETVIRLFDVASGREVRRLALGSDERYYSLAFSPDGRKLACSYSSSERGCVLNAATGRVLYRLTDRPIQLSFSPDGKTLLGSTGQRLRLWDAATGKERHERPADLGWNPAIAMSPDGRLLASADWLAREVSLWDARTGRLLRHLPVKGEGRYVRNLAFSGDGKALAAAQGMGFLQFWDSASGKELRSIQLRDAGAANDPSLYFFNLHFSPDHRHVSSQERRFGAGRWLTRLGQWSTADGVLRRNHQLDGEVRHGAWRADGKQVALLLGDGLTLVEASTGASRFRIADTQGPPLAASPDYRLLAAPRKSGPVGVWEALSGKEVASVAAGRVAHLALTPDSRCLVTTDERFLRVHDLATGKERRRWLLPVAMTDSWGSTFVHALHLSPDGRRVFTALADGSGLMWDLAPALESSPPVKVPGKKELAAWWADLASEDARRAYAAIWRLEEAPRGAGASFVARQFQPRPVDGKEVRRLIDDLDSDTFTVREKATRRLETLGDAVLPAVHEALGKGPSLEVRRRLEKLLARQADLTSPEVRRRLRALRVLEHAGSSEARQALTALSQGSTQAPEVQEAKAALERLAHRAGRP